MLVLLLKASAVQGSVVLKHAQRLLRRVSRTAKRCMLVLVKKQHDQIRAVTYLTMEFLICAEKIHCESCVCVPCRVVLICAGKAATCTDPRSHRSLTMDTLIYALANNLSVATHGFQDDPWPIPTLLLAAAHSKQNEKTCTSCAFGHGMVKQEIGG